MHLSRGLAGRSLLGVAIALALAGNTMVLTRRNVTTEVTLDGTLERFRSDAAGPADATNPLPSSTVPTTSSAEAAPRDGLASAAVSAARTAVPVLALPAEGVYTYRTSGGEEISITGAAHEYPDRTYATVRHAGGCRWDWEHRVVEEHIDQTAFCGAGADLLVHSRTAIVTFFGERNESRWNCDPPLLLLRLGDAPGTQREYGCSGSDGSSDNRIVFRGVARMTIGRSTVDALHVINDSHVTGRAEGTARAELWLHPATGLALKVIRTVETETREFGTTVTYRENATFELVSLDPQT